MKHYLFLVFFLPLNHLLAQHEKFLGVWKTIDEISNQEKSYVELYLKNDKLYGKVIKLLPPIVNSICQNCPAEKKDKNLIGLDILWDMQKYKDSYSYGQIVDPKTGNVYSCNLNLQDEDTLIVRGYLGLNLFGHSQLWYRVK